jgi:hypothetical protein
MSRGQLALAVEVENRTGWCDDCHQETMMEVTYYVTPMRGRPYLEQLVWCEICDPAEVEEK